MSRESLTAEQKKAGIDLWIILITAFIVLGVFTVFNSDITVYVTSLTIPILLRTLFTAMIQFGIAGLGITLVCIFRKESFLKYGLYRKKLFITLLLSAVMFLPNIIFSVVTGDFQGYFPFQGVRVTKEIWASPILTRIFGMLIIATAWGFFEGFNYPVIMEKINLRYPSKHLWADPGAISCALMCILIHGAVGVTPSGIIEMLTVFISIYGILMVRKFTGNAWGCIFIFIFLWNAY
jgi:hypothetical protein